MSANRDAAARGASIVRVFILDGDRDEHLVEHVVKDHIESGVGVWIVKADRLEPAKVVDLCVFNENIVSTCYSARPGSELEQVIWSQFDEAIEKFHAIRNYYSYRAQKIASHAELAAWQQAIRPTTN